jgi:PAS domain S-box-containing protein
VPNLERSWIESYGRVALTGERLRFTQGSPAMGGRWFDVHASRVGQPEQRLVALLFNDVTAHQVEQENRRRAEEALRASEHKFRVFADTAPAMLWVTETDGRCTYLSRGWHQFTGQTDDEGLGYGWLDAVHPEDREVARQTFLSANAAQQPFELEHRLRRADGAYRWVIDAGHPRFAPDGRFDGYVGSVIDIHDRKLAEDRLDLAVRSGEVGLWHCDLPFDVLVWNQQVKEHFGLPPDARVTIETFFERQHPDDREKTQTAVGDAIENRVPTIPSIEPLGSTAGRAGFGRSGAPATTGIAPRASTGSPSTSPRWSRCARPRKRPARPRTSSWRCSATSCETRWRPSSPPSSS